MMDIRNGDTLWTKNLPVDFPSTDWYNKLSALKDGVLYASRAGNNNDAYLYALNAADGSIIWQSADLIDESPSEGLNFTEDGDLIVGNIHSILKISKIDGSTIWQTPRLAYPDGAELTVNGSKIYGIINDFQQIKIATYDVTSGQLLYKSPSLGGGLVQQQGLFLGADGTVYFPRSQNNPITDSLYSFTDDGSALIRNWSQPIHYVPFSSSAEGNDGSLYSYSRSGRVIRINPTSGIVTDSSEVIFYGDATYPRMAIDAAGRIFVSNGGFSDGNFYSFNADLSLRWQKAIPNIYIGGPILGWGGTLVICGTGANIWAYRGDPSASLEEETSNLSGVSTSVFPNPFNDVIHLKVDPSLVGNVFIVHDQIGKIVLMGTISSEDSVLDLSYLSKGMYTLNIQNMQESIFKIIKH